jgi:small subunit ribosomal protein S27e
MKPIVPMPKSRFLQIQCKKCKNKQTIFSRAASKIKCLKCGEILAESTGGEVRIKARILRVLS